MSDDFRTTFVVEAVPGEVWRALTERTLEGGGDGDAVHYVLPGFPSFETLPIPGASCTPLEVEPERLLRVRKDHDPCRGTEIAVQLEQVDTGTRITLVQSGFDAAFLQIVGRDVVFGHGAQIARDLHLYLERGVTAPGTAWGVNLAATPRQRPFGLEIASVHPGGFAEKAGMQPGDLLLTLKGIRLHDVQQLQTVLALTEPGIETEVTWIRDREPMSAKLAF